MDAASIPDITEDELRRQLADLTRIALAGEQAERERKNLIVLAIERFRWTQDQVAAACPTAQGSVSRIWRAHCKRQMSRSD